MSEISTRKRLEALFDKQLSKFNNQASLHAKGIIEDFRDQRGELISQMEDRFEGRTFADNELPFLPIVPRTQFSLSAQMAWLGKYPDLDENYVLDAGMVQDLTPPQRWNCAHFAVDVSWALVKDMPPYEPSFSLAAPENYFFMDAEETIALCFQQGLLDHGNFVIPRTSSRTTETMPAYLGLDRHNKACLGFVLWSVRPLYVGCLKDKRPFICGG